MRRNIFTLLAFALTTFLFGQKKLVPIVPLQKSDSLNKTLIDLQNTDSILKTVKIKNEVRSIVLPNAQPKDAALYLALKGKARDDQAYPILNAIPAKNRLPIIKKTAQ